MTKLFVKLKKIPTITYTYDYEFTDSKGVKVTGVEIPNEKEAIKAIKDKTKHLKDYEIEIIDC